MEFVNRKKELEELESMYKLSKKSLFPVLISGHRRVGKTELAKHFIKDKKHLYFFVYEGKSKQALLKDFEQELKNKKIMDAYTKINSFDQFFEILFKKCSNYVIVFDEVQYIKNIYRPFFSLMQRKIDENKLYSCMILFLGSVIGLIKIVFEDLKAPLYGRMKSKLLLKPFFYKDVKKMMIKLGYSKEEDFIKFYTVFGGFPKYYVAMEDFKLQKKPLLEVIRFLFFRENAPLKNEIIDILRQEFGKRKSYYYDILEAISTSHTKLNEIASCLGKHQTEITSFMRDMIEYYEMIRREVIITEDPRKSRNSIYVVNSQLFKFWFKFVYPNLNYVEIKEFGYIMKIINKSINSFVGLGFENVCKQFIKPLFKEKFCLVGKWWGHYRDKENNRKAIEIDIVALNERAKEILFCECKWKDDVNAEKILAELKEKAKHVGWNQEKRKEHYAIFAKSFRRKLKEKNVYCFDLKDIRKILKRKN